MITTILTSESLINVDATHKSAVSKLKFVLSWPAHFVTVCFTSPDVEAFDSRCIHRDVKPLVWQVLSRVEDVSIRQVLVGFGVFGCVRRLHVRVSCAPILQREHFPSLEDVTLEVDAPFNETPRFLFEKATRILFSTVMGRYPHNLRDVGQLLKPNKVSRIIGVGLNGDDCFKLVSDLSFFEANFNSLNELRVVLHFDRDPPRAPNDFTSRGAVCTHPGWNLLDFCVPEVREYDLTRSGLVTFLFAIGTSRASRVRISCFDQDWDTHF